MLPALVVWLLQDSRYGEVTGVSSQDRAAGGIKRAQHRGEERACISASKISCSVAVHVKRAVGLPSAVNGAASSE